MLLVDSTDQRNGKEKPDEGKETRSDRFKILRLRHEHRVQDNQEQGEDVFPQKACVFIRQVQYKQRYDGVVQEGRRKRLYRDSGEQDHGDIQHGQLLFVSEEVKGKPQDE